MTNLINCKELLKFNGRKFIDCGVFRDSIVQITENFGVYRLEIETDIKGYFRTAFKSNNFNEVKDFYLNTYGICYTK